MCLKARNESLAYMQDVNSAGGNEETSGDSGKESAKKMQKESGQGGGDVLEAVPQCLQLPKIMGECHNFTR